MYRVQVDCSRCLYVESTGNPSATWASQLSEQDMGLATGRQVGRLVLGAFDLGRRLSSWRFAERIHRNRRILNVDDLEMLRLPWRAQVHAVAGARFHQRIGERRAPADVAAVEVPPRRCRRSTRHVRARQHPCRSRLRRSRRASRLTAAAMRQDRRPRPRQCAA